MHLSPEAWTFRISPSPTRPPAHRPQHHQRRRPRCPARELLNPCMSRPTGLAGVRPSRRERLVHTPPRGLRTLPAPPGDLSVRAGLSHGTSHGGAGVATPSRAPTSQKQRRTAAPVAGPLRGCRRRALLVRGTGRFAAPPRAGRLAALPGRACCASAVCLVSSALAAFAMPVASAWCAAHTKRTLYTADTARLARFLCGVWAEGVGRRMRAARRD